jgi:hypothetical protein
MKLLEENSSEPCYGQEFFSSIAQETKTKKDKEDFIKLKSFWTTKDIIRRKGQPTKMGENICNLYMQQGVIASNPPITK